MLPEPPIHAGASAMSLEPPVFRFDQLHVDVARNATDDFNLFHDPQRWMRIRGNPFRGPIVLGFQLEALIDFLIERQRAAESPDPSQMGAGEPPFANYEFRFAHELNPGESFRAEVRRTVRARRPGGETSNRVSLRRLDDTPILIGARTDTNSPRFLGEWEPGLLPRLDGVPDRSFVAGTGLFLKRKFLNNSNAKNFLLGSLVDQLHYFDELAERVHFPPIFTASLISCALLEKCWAEGYDFERNPQVYLAHYFSIDRRLQGGLRSNGRLDILIDGPHPVAQSGGLSGARTVQDAYRCYGMLAQGQTLFRAEVRTTTLQRILAGADGT
jgi:hypothetical protein